MNDFNEEDRRTIYIIMTMVLIILIVGYVIR